MYGSNKSHIVPYRQIRTIIKKNGEKKLKLNSHFRIHIRKRHMHTLGTFR